MFKNPNLPQQVVLGVSWINNHLFWGKCQWYFYLAQTPMKIHLRWNRLEQCISLNKNWDVWSIGDPRREMFVRNLCFSTKSVYLGAI